MVCVCCERACDTTFSMYGHHVCFECTMNRSHAAIMTVIQEKLNLNVKTWGSPTPASS